MRNPGKRKSNKMKVDNSNRTVQSYEKLENPQFLDSVTCLSPTRKDKCFHDEKELVKETKKLLSENEEMSIHTKEDNPNDVQIEPHTVGVNSGGTQVLPEKKNQKHLKITKTEEKENISLSQNQHDRFKSTDLHRISANKHYQPQSLSNVSDRKGNSLENKKRNSKQSKNGVNSPVGFTRDHPSERIQKGQSSINEASVNCISPSNEKLNVNTIESLKSKETIPEEFNTKKAIKYPRNKSSGEYHLNIEMPLSNTSQALNGPHKDKIGGLFSSQFSNQNTTDNMTKRKDDIDYLLKLKESNLQDGTSRKEDTIKIQQTKLNVYAEEFFPTDKCYNQSRCSKKNEKETVTPNSTNVKKKVTTGDRQHTAESQNFIKKNEKVGKNEHMSSSCENNNSPNESVNNEAPKHDGFENESINFSNPYESQYNGECAYVFPEHLTDQNGFNCFNTDLNFVRCKSLVLQCNYKGTTYFHVYPNCVYGGHSGYTLFNNRRRTNDSLCCPYCQSLNPANESSRI